MPVAFSMREYAGGRPSQSSVARRPSPCTPTLLGTEGVLRCCVCCVVDFCLYAAVLRMERCADLVSVFFGTYSGTLGRSGPCILRYLWWYAGRSGPCILRYLWWYAEPGCCGGGVITTWAAGDGVIAAELLSEPKASSVLGDLCDPFHKGDRRQPCISRKNSRIRRTLTHITMCNH